MECPSFYFTGFLHYINLFSFIRGLFFMCYVFFLYSFLPVLLIRVLKICPNLDPDPGPILDPVR